ncbi:MAG: hypothetical protein H0W50_10300 [Parachlamydiaceae bacterium]|nr:hypothetical protein [Parachlamydiaceae bacterium]
MIDPNITSISHEIKPISSKGFFEDFHGRVVSSLSSFPSSLLDLAKRIVILIAAVFVYPIWGITLIAQGIQGKIVKSTGKSSRSSDKENISMSNKINQRISHSLKLWHLESCYKGDMIKIFYGTKYNDQSFKSHFFIKNSVDSNKDFQGLIYTLIVENLKSQIGINYNSKSSIDIQAIVLGLRRDDEVDIIDYQLFKQSYVGLNGNGHLGMHNEELKDSFLEIENPILTKPIWDDKGEWIL